LCVSLPPDYPFSRAAPQLQLLSRYIGSFGVDSEIFGTVTRTFISNNASRGALPLWNPPLKLDDGNGDNAHYGMGEVVVFDGVESARAAITKWYGEKASQAAADESERADEVVPSHIVNQSNMAAAAQESPRSSHEASMSVPKGITIIEGSPIHDRGSTFVARVCQITHPSQVPLVLDPFLPRR
jgi:hypothetical protein